MGARRRLAQVPLGALRRDAAAGCDRARARRGPRSSSWTSRSPPSTHSRGPRLQDVLLRVHGTREGRPVTIVHVAHDVDEAVYLADRVLVFSRAPGRVVGSIEVGLPRPRSQRSTRSSAAFLACRDELHLDRLATGVTVIGMPGGRSGQARLGDCSWPPPGWRSSSRWRPADCPGPRRAAREAQGDDRDSAARAGRARLRCRASRLLRAAGNRREAPRPLGPGRSSSPPCSRVTPSSPRTGVGARRA